MHYFEGLEQQLRILEDEESNFSTNPLIDLDTQLLACANCFELKKDCKCNERAYWPIHYVIVKLRWLLRRRVAS